MDELLELMESAEVCYRATVSSTGACIASLLALQMEIANVDRCRDLPLGDREAAIDAVAGLFDCSKS